MRILHISWEFPPVLYGGLGRHVAALSAAQARLGHEVAVLTQHGEGTPDTEVVSGVTVVRAAEDGDGQPRTFDNLLPWVSAMQAAMTARGGDLVHDWRPDVVHAHDWVVGTAATAIAEAAGARLVATFHATEAGRHSGWIVGNVSHSIHEAEVDLAARSGAVIVCSRAMRDEVQLALGADARVAVVANGVDLDEWSASPDDAARARGRLGLADSTPLVVFCGRIVWEKGLQTAIEALPALRAAHPGLVLAVAGRGPFEEDLRSRASDSGVSESVRFLGFLPESQLRPLIAAADCAVVPSLYEPFGMVAVEAAALGTPVVASDVGGLRDIVIDWSTGLLVEPGDAPALASAVDRLLSDRGWAHSLAAAARLRAADSYSWQRIAEETVEVYRVAGPLPGRDASAAPKAERRDRNVLTGEPAGS